jgi:hypothetical protein
LAPLALAVAMHSALPGPGSPPPPGSTDAIVCPAEIDDATSCHTQFPTGCSPSARYDGYLNFLKNRFPPTAETPLRTLGKNDIADLDRKIPKELTKSNHDDFKDPLQQAGEGRLHTVIGYLYYAKNGGKESVNCELEGSDAIDFHIAIGFDDTLAGKVLKKQSHEGALTKDDQKTLEKNSMIVEMTPHYRAQVKPDWNLDVVKAALGRQVKVTGLLLLDNEHQDPKDNCALGDNDTCWRMSTWELHPVTGFEVCKADKCAENSADWVELTDFTPPSKTAPTK